jgi:hypothetical protein
LVNFGLMFPKIFSGLRVPIPHSFHGIKSG